MGRTAEIKDWLREFPPEMTRDGEKTCCWDWLPADWTAKANFYDRDQWTQEPVFREIGVREEYQKVAQGLDELIESHGYRREDGFYRVLKPNTDTVVLFCHFGLECVLLSHLLGVSPMVLWHGFCAAPTSVTTLYTEERRECIASFRVAHFGDISHLYVDGRAPSFSGRFCETYDNWNERHD
jgi:probable phosphoglycerate mutase